jgi:hypothetical protein
MTTQKNMRFDEETTAKITELATKWSPVKPLTASDVVRECVRLVHAAVITDWITQPQTR